MPISFDGKIWEFQELVSWLEANRPDIDCPKCFVGKLEQEQNATSSGVATAAAIMQGSTIVADLGHDHLFEKNGKKFAKIFLISSVENLKKWKVTAESVPRRLRTFIKRPYISEPGLAHFDTDQIPIEETLKKQEKFRAGTIQDVVVENGIAYAVVEFENNELGNRAWREMKNGKAIYSSPAVAGIWKMVDGVKTFVDWFGLHLARVDKPAYGVFHATIKETCEGSERECIRNLVTASASYLEDSSEILHKFTHSQMSTVITGQEECPPGPEGEDCRSKKMQQMSASLSDIKGKIDKLVAAIPGSEGKTTPVTDPVGGEKQKQPKATGQENGCPPGEAKNEAGDCVKSPATAQENGCPEGKEKNEAGDCVESAAEHPSDCGPNQHRNAEGQCVESASVINELQSKVASYENEKKTSLITQLIDLKETAGMVDLGSAATEKENLGKLSLSKLQSEIATILPYVEKIAETNMMAGKIPSSANKIVRMPDGSIGTASMDGTPQTIRVSSLKDIKGTWYN